MFDVIREGKYLRTFIVVGSSENCVPRILNDFGDKFPRLLTLDLSNSGISELPRLIGKLKHLRCLQLQNTKIRQFPKSICNLYLLQTPGLRNCYDLEELPRKIKNLRKLRHIDLVMTCNPCRNDCSLKFAISKRSALSIHTCKKGIGELANLNNLNGELLISGLEHVNDMEEAVHAHLASKKFLEKGWDGLVSMNCSQFCGSNTASFRSLKKLHLERLDMLHRWDGDNICSFPSLLELVVKKCQKLELVAHKLPSLTKMTVEGSPNFCGLRNFPSLTHVNVTESGEWIWGSWSGLSSPISIILSKLPTVHLPSGPRWFHSSLQRLDISHCKNLECMPEDWPPCNLSHFSVRHCPQLHKLPSGIRHLRALEDLEIIDCGQLTCLPDLDRLTSLLWMEISNCGSIQFLPYLPSSMQFLSINNCPQLRLSCMKEGSLDQAKIKRIFSVWIDGAEVFSSADESRFVIPAKLQKG
uniref:Disease resistance R13L4/SHOC-2-like LRR domain-containing protein n=1 Tax=Oryza rufipogon TaxID=4529 RepID=A0A0E0R158_ORYRU